MIIDVYLDLSCPGHRRKVNISLISDSVMTWSGKITSTKGGSLISADDQTAIQYGPHGSFLATRDVKFTYQGSVLCEVVFPRFKDSYLVFENEIIPYSYRGYLLNRGGVVQGIHVQRGYDEVVGAIRIDSDCESMNKVLSVALTSLVYELVESERG